MEGTPPVDSISCLSTAPYTSETKDSRSITQMPIASELAERLKF